MCGGRVGGYGKGWLERVLGGGWGVGGEIGGKYS